MKKESGQSVENKMKISNDGLNFIKELEGCRLYAYDDLTGKKLKKGGICKGTLTIGIGHTGTDVYPGQVIDIEQAMNLLKSDLKQVEQTINESVCVPLTQNQYDALCSFVFNIGCNAFKKSTVLKTLNKGWYEQAALCFHNWHRGNGIPHILDARRDKEKEFFLKS